MNVPQLRFDGFDDIWISKRLLEITKVNQGLQIPIAERYLEPGDKRYFYITNEFLKRNSKYEYYIEKPTDSVICTNEDILMTRTGNTGMVVTGVSGAFHNNFFKIKFKEKEVNKDFLILFLKSSRTQNEILKMAGQSTIPDLNHTDFYKLEIKLPTLIEQEKISSFFGLLNQRIERQQEKIDKLEQFKKGMMQKIFSQELRFKDEDGGEFPEWEEKKLGQVLKIKHGRDQKKIETPDGKFPILATGGTIGRTDTFIYDKESVLIGRKGTIDRPVYMNSPFWTVDTLFYSEIRESNYAKFIFYIFQNINWKFYNEASGVPSLSAKTIEAIKITAPTFKEQKVIADYLSVIDKKIEKENEKLMVLEEQKKGFMQGMFV